MRLDKVGMHLIDHERSHYPSRGKRRLRSIFIFEHLCDSVLRKCGTPTGYFKHMSTHHADGKVDSFVPGVGAPPQQVMSSTCLNIMRMWMITTQSAHLSTKVRITSDSSTFINVHQISAHIR